MFRDGRNILFRSRDVSVSSGGEAIMPVLVWLLWQEREEDLLLFRLKHVYSSASIFGPKPLIWPQQGDGLQGDVKSVGNTPEVERRSSRAVNTVPRVEVRTVLPYRETGTRVFVLIKTRIGPALHD